MKGMTKKRLIEIDEACKFGELNLETISDFFVALNKFGGKVVNTAFTNNSFNGDEVVFTYNINDVLGWARYGNNDINNRFSK